MGAHGWLWGVARPPGPAPPAGRLLRRPNRRSCSAQPRRGGGSRGLEGQETPPPGAHGRYLVDSASSHMLVSKIKPCMSKYKHLIL